MGSSSCFKFQTTDWQDIVSNAITAMNANTGTRSLKTAYSERLTSLFFQNSQTAHKLIKWRQLNAWSAYNIMLPPEKQTRGFHELAHHHWYDYNYRRHRRPWLLYKNRRGPSLKGHGGR